MKPIYALVLLVFISVMTSAAIALPDNFQKNQIIGSGLDKPTAFEFAPDGRVFILEKDGNVRIYKNGQLLSQPFHTFSVDSEGEKGLLGIAFDPQFSSTHDAYFYYIDSGGKPTIARLDASSDTSSGGPAIIYQAQQQSGEIHHGGTIRFGPDGKIYVAIGDNGYGPNAQDRSNVRGSMIRINKDGSIPSDNPFVGQSGIKPEIWAYGFRNPYRFQFDSNTGSLYLGDVGHNDYEEVNRVVKGGNYGWPECEGFCDRGYINPLHAYDHTYQGQYQSSSVTGGPVYRATQFPSEYQGSLFFGDYARGWIRYMKLDSSGNNNGVFFFGDGLGTIADIKQAPDGSLYYMTIFPGQLHRISYNSGNQAPVAKADATPKQGEPPLSVKFSSEGSYDPEGRQISYRWDFGDGTTSTSANPSKTYDDRGKYTAKLTVSDGETSSQSSPITIQVGTPPSVSISSPDDGSLFRAGDSIHYSVSASDSDGNAISNSNVFIKVDLHHGSHIHPFLERTGKSGSFEIPTTGHTEHNIWYRVYATAKDGDGLTSTEYVEIFPRKSDMTFMTEPNGFEITIDGQPKQTPHSELGVEMVQRELKAYYINYLSGQTYVFDRWSDGGDRQHAISTPIDDTTYVAYYRQADPATSFKAEYFTNRDLSGSPALTRYDPFVDFNWGYEHSPAPGIPGDHFSARWTKSQYFDGDGYRFVITADDGVRLWIDGKIVLDKWIDQPPTTYAVDVPIEAGTRDIKLEYYEKTERALIDLKWYPLSYNYFDSGFYMSPNINEWWQEVNVEPHDGRAVVQLYIRSDGGGWVPMQKASWGNWVSNVNIPQGSSVEFMAVDKIGMISQSAGVSWMDTLATQSTKPTSFPAQFYTSPTINNYWVEVNAASSYGITEVDVSINGGGWIALEKKHWGNWARSIEVSSVSEVRFRAKNTAGHYAFSEPVIWP